MSQYPIVPHEDDEPDEVPSPDGADVNNGGDYDNEKIEEIIDMAGEVVTSSVKLIFRIFK